MTENDNPMLENEASDEEFKAALEAALDAAEVSDEDLADAEAADDEFVAVDSLQGNEFAVEINNEVVSGVFRVSGLVTFDLFPEEDDDDDEEEVEYVTIAKMVQRNANLPFNAWLRETIDAGTSGDRPTRNVAIVAIDDGEETRRWTLKDAYILSVTYSDFDTSSTEFVEEVIDIGYESIIEAWTWSDSQ
ncbi:MAG: phage tail protein, partial [Chloroflexota bacterium]